MGAEKGRLIICDRCKEGSIFLKYTGKSYGSNLSDPSGYDVFEVLPDNWIFDSRFGYLCPACAKKFVSIISEFFGEEKYSKMTSSWHIKEDLEE